MLKGHNKVADKGKILNKQKVSQGNISDDFDGFNDNNFDANGLFLDLKQRGHEFIKWIGFDRKRNDDETIFDQPDEGGVCVISDVQSYNIEDLNKDSNLNFKFGDWYLAEILPDGESLLHGPFGHLNVAVSYGYKLGVKSYRCAVSPIEPAPSQRLIDAIRPDLIERIRNSSEHQENIRSLQRGKAYIIALVDGRYKHIICSEQEYLERTLERQRYALSEQFSSLTTEKVIGYIEMTGEDITPLITYILADDEVLLPAR